MTRYERQSGLPSQAIGNGATRVLLALLGADRPTVRDIGRRAGLSSTSTVHSHLKTLRRLGLVRWESDHAATLRPCVEAHHAYQEAARRAKGIGPSRGRKTGRTCGKRSTYKAGCHCADCRRAEANYQCLYRRRKRREAGVPEKRWDWAIDVKMGRAA